VILAARTPVDLNVSEGQVGDSERVSIRARVRERERERGATQDKTYVQLGGPSFASSANVVGGGWS
jgi:hypothetical protein